MKSTLLILILILLHNTSFSQITTKSVKNKKEIISTEPYDSTQNFVGKDVYKYIGQNLYLNGKSETLRKYGYDGFSLDFTKPTFNNESNIYKCCDRFGSKYDELAGKYFTVLSYSKHPQKDEDEDLYGKKFFLELEENKSKDIVYYEYDSSFESIFPFIVVGYFEKASIKYMGTEYVLRGRNWFESKPEMYDILTGVAVDYSAGTIWKCVDFTIEERYYSLSLIIENSNGEQLAYSLDYLLKGNRWVYPKQDSDKYQEVFGKENWDIILAGKVKIGMTKDMCIQSWGAPDEINQTTMKGESSEQWVYERNYLYFDNGILTAIQ